MIKLKVYLVIFNLETMILPKKFNLSSRLFKTSISAKLKELRDTNLLLSITYLILTIDSNKKYRQASTKEMHSIHLRNLLDFRLMMKTKRQEV